MHTNRKILASIVLCIWACIGPHTACVFAQPLGLMSQQPQVQPQSNVLGCAGGRFVFGQISDSNKDQFMLDTLSGRLWRVAESGDVGMYLTPVLYRTSDGSYSPLPDETQAQARPSHNK